MESVTDVQGMVRHVRQARLRGQYSVAPGTQSPILRHQLVWGGQHLQPPINMASSTIRALAEWFILCASSRSGRFGPQKQLSERVVWRIADDSRIASAGLSWAASFGRPWCCSPCHIPNSTWSKPKQALDDFRAGTMCL